MLSFIIYFAILNTCSSLCPAPFNKQFKRWWVFSYVTKSGAILRTWNRRYKLGS